MGYFWNTPRTWSSPACNWSASADCQLAYSLWIATGLTLAVAIHKLYTEWKSDAADKLQEGLDRIRLIFQKYPMIPAMKCAVAHWSGHPGWVTMRPPLVELGAEQSAALIAELKQAGFSMPGLDAA